MAAWRISAQIFGLCYLKARKKYYGKSQGLKDLQNAKPISISLIVLLGEKRQEYCFKAVDLLCPYMLCFNFDIVCISTSKNCDLVGAFKMLFWEIFVSDR